MKRILLVEDDVQINELLSIHLRDFDCDLSTCTDGGEGLSLALNRPFDLIILDINLPTTDGLEICKTVRSNQITTPIIMLTARADEIDKVVGLELGADDYLTKPFSIREFMARIKALLRRSVITADIKGGSSDYIKYDGLTIETNKRKVLLNEKRIDLTPKEFDLLVLLASNPGKTYSRDRLLRIVWGYDFEGYQNTVNSHINRLRGKVENNIAKPKYILTTWGVGYRFNDEIN
jgi:DNA-binding response OmpR family regulator